MLIYLIKFFYIMSFYFVKIAGLIKRSANKITRMKEDYQLYKKFLETKDPHIYKQEKQKIFGLNKEEINRSPQESMKKNPYYWYHELKQKAYDYIYPEDKYKLLEEAKTNVEKVSPQASKVLLVNSVDTFNHQKALPYCH
jgi:hypothetical protein